MTRFLSAAFVLALCVAPLGAADTESLPPNAKVLRLAVQPAKVDLAGPFAYSQLVVTATLDTGDAVDVTRMAKFTPPSCVKITPTGQVRPTAGGSGILTIAVATASLEVPIAVTSFHTPAPVSFLKDVQPALSKMGCNAGTCHGAAQGKVGFKLSLRGYDPIYDHRALTDDLEGRRFNRAAPDRSLMLMKPAGAVPHVGGVLCSPGEPYYEMLKQWIAEGVKLDLSTPKVASLEVFPKDPTLGRLGSKQQFAVIATYADGSKRDVSAEAFLESSNTEIATVDKAGLLTTLRRGETTVLIRYEGAYTASTVIALGDRTGYAWKAPQRFNWIDELVDAKLQKVKVLPSELCDDADFVRRVHIDLTGLPPSADDVRKFLADTRPTQQKRDALVDSLVGSEAFVDHWTNKWSDLLQVNRKFLGEPGAKALRDWVRNAVAKNMPYDQFAYAILSASGSNVENPPASYYKILRTPDAIMENTTQLFLAVRFNCNKCHDHPFEKWTQDQYYEMAAYFAKVNLKEDPKFKGQRLGATAVEGAKPMVEIVSDDGTGEVKHDRTGAVTMPKFPYVHVSLPAKELSRREQVAKWITSPDNQYFAKSYVNRLWSYLLGVGIIEPVDDIRAGNPPTNPELLDRLTKEFIASGFDTRKLVTTICKSRTYQLSIATNPFNKDDEINYSHALPRRLPAEVLFDAIHRATGSPSRLPGLPAGARAAQLIDSNVDLPGGFLELFGKPVRESACECERSNTMMLGPVLAMVNGPIVAEAIKSAEGHLSKFTLANPDDAKVIEEIYLSVLNRKPTPAEVQAGIVALRSAETDHAKMTAAYHRKAAAFHDYRADLDAKQAVWEAGQRELKPTTWITLDPKTFTAKSGATFAKQADGSLLVSGKTTQQEEYTVTAETKLKAITAVRLEVLSDPSLPSKGPGRSPNGNFVLNEFKANSRLASKPDDKPKGVKFVNAQATFSQEGLPPSNLIDNNLDTGWAILPQVGMNQAVLLPVQGTLGNPEGTHLTFVLDQRYQDGKHQIGRFRLSVTTDKKPLLTTPVTPEMMAMFDTPTEKRSVDVKAKLRQMYLAQDREYQRLAAELGTVPPTDARVLGAQDLVWALINSPAFLFNH